MQRGSLALVSRKEGPAVWQFRWSEKDLHGARIQRKRVIGTVERYPPPQPTTDDFHVLRRPSRTCTALRVTAQRD